MRNLGWPEILMIAGATILLFGGKILPFVSRRLAENVRAVREVFTRKGGNA